MSRSIVTLIQQSNKILDIVAPKVKEEANKKIIEIKQKIPTKDSVKQIMMDEITSRGPELVCSIEVRNRIDFIYNKLISSVEKMQSLINLSHEKLVNLQEKLLQINKIIIAITAIIEALKALIPVLQTIAISAQVGLYLLKGPAADVDAGLKLKDQIDKSNNKVKEINNSVKVFEKKVRKIQEKFAIILGITTLAIGVILTLKTTINAVIGLIEGFYLKYTLMCNVEGDSMEDEAYQAAVDDAQSNLDDMLGGTNSGGSDQEIYIPEDELLPNTIERIKNANFKVIQYRIA